jgi:hypothetical protein
MVEVRANACHHGNRNFCMPRASRAGNLSILHNINASNTLQIFCQFFAKGASSKTMTQIQALVAI